MILDLFVYNTCAWCGCSNCLKLCPQSSLLCLSIQSRFSKVDLLKWKTLPLLDLTFEIFWVFGVCPPSKIDSFEFFRVSLVAFCLDFDSIPLLDLRWSSLIPKTSLFLPLSEIGITGVSLGVLVLWIDPTFHNFYSTRLFDFNTSVL